MNQSDEIRFAIQKLSGFDELTFESCVGTAFDIDTTKNICKVKPIDESADFHDVRLSVNTKNGFVLVPKKDSLVVVTQITDSDSYIAMVSEVDEILLAGDGFGGLIKIAELSTELAKLETFCNSVATALGLPTPFPPTPTVDPTLIQSKIENKKVKHGSGS